MLSRFNIDDRVESLRTGPPMTGTVVGIVSSNMEIQRYRNMGLKVDDDDFRWTSLYPTWKQEPVYYVYRDKPDRTISFDEWKLRDGGTLKRYLKEVDLVTVTAYPEQDLRRLDENICRNWT